MSELTQHLNSEKQNNTQAEPEKKKRGRPKKIINPNNQSGSQAQPQGAPQQDFNFKPCPATAMIYKITLQIAFGQILLKGKREVEIKDEQVEEASGALKFILDHYSVNMSPLMAAVSVVAINVAGIYFSSVMPLQNEINEENRKSAKVIDAVAGDLNANA